MIMRVVMKRKRPIIRTERPPGMHFDGLGLLCFCIPKTGFSLALLFRLSGNSHIDLDLTY